MENFTSEKHCRGFYLIEDFTSEMCCGEFCFRKELWRILPQKSGVEDFTSENYYSGLYLRKALWRILPQKSVAEIKMMRGGEERESISVDPDFLKTRVEQEGNANK